MSVSYNLRWRGVWRVGEGFRWAEYCRGCDAPEHVLTLTALSRRLPAHFVGNRRQPGRGLAWALVCMFSPKKRA